MSMFGIIPVVLGLFSALTWGAADFSGGLASKHSSAYGVVIGGQATGLALLLALVNLTGEPVPSLSSWLWGGAAGLCGGVGLSILYRALAVAVTVAGLPAAPGVKAYRVAATTVEMTSPAGWGVPLGSKLHANMDATNTRTTEMSLMRAEMGCVPR